LLLAIKEEESETWNEKEEEETHTHTRSERKNCALFFKHEAKEKVE